MDIEKRVLEYLKDEGGQTSFQVAVGLGLNSGEIERALIRLHDTGFVTTKSIPERLVRDFPDFANFCLYEAVMSEEDANKRIVYSI